MSKMEARIEHSVIMNTTPSKLRQLADEADARWLHLHPGDSTVFYTVYEKDCTVEFSFDQDAMRKESLKLRKEP